MTETAFGRIRSGKPVDRNDPDVREFDKALAYAGDMRIECNTKPMSPSERTSKLAGILMRPVTGLTVVSPPFFFDLGFSIILGKDVMVNYNATMLDDAETAVGDGTLIGPNAQIPAAAHPADPGPGRANVFLAVARKIAIGENIRMGAGAAIMPGIAAGDNAAVGAGAAVAHGAEPGTVAVSVPARVLGKAIAL